MRCTRPELVSHEQAARIHELAKRILREVGMEVRHPATLDVLRSAGYRVDGDHVFFESLVVDQYVDDMRRWIAERPSLEPPPDDGRLTLSVSSYSLFVHDIETERVVPYTTDRLIEQCKFMDSLAEEGVEGAPPGIPMDEPPELQPISQYRIAALYARQGATPVDPTSAATVNHLLDMAEVMGEPIHSLPVYVPSPLRLGGESLDVVLACVDRLSHVSISSMPSTGASAPIEPFAALAMAAAEVIGGMIAVRHLCDKPVTFGVNIFPFDLRAGAMVFGSPENLLYQMLCADFNRFYGWERERGPSNIHVMSKLPDAQAAADKAAIMSVGAHLGARHFGSAGTLSLDEIFSPEQLLVDCEIRDWVQRAVRGLDVEQAQRDDSQRLEEMVAGVQRGFMGQEQTLADYLLCRQGGGSTWYPRHFQRAPIGPWLAAGEPRLSARLKDDVRRRIARHDFELDAARRAEIERIYRSARNVHDGVLR